MLSSHKMKLVEELFSTFTREELFWLNGFIAGKFTGEAKAEAPAVISKPSVNRITIAYGTETGNSKKLAAEFAAKAKKSGINAKLVSMDQYRLNDLSKEEYFLSIISTQGEGEPPAAAKKFYDHIHTNGFKLEKLKYGVLALGDTSYPLFCKAGEDVDRQLNNLGGERLVPLQKCDVDYEIQANGWFEDILRQLSNSAGQEPVTIAAPVTTKPAQGKKIYKGTIITNINLNDRGSNKETHHIEIAADGVDYLPGDALGLIPENPLHLVESALQLLNLRKEEIIHYKNQQVTAFDLFKKKLNIIYLPERVVARYAALTGQEIPSMKIGLSDLVRIYPLQEGQHNQLIDLLEPLAPRLYSISSSPEAHPGEIHLTVARDRFLVNEELKCGLCSDYLSSLNEDSTIEFYIHKNNGFRLPAGDKDIIMVGPGTGIAPFRSFLAQRDANGDNGRNWLFFGDQHFVTDFLYQTEFQNWVDTGLLTNMNVAFSRDQEEKLYVQHKMLQHGQELYDWIAGGATFYVCGTRHPMSEDVENTLVRIVELFGKKSTEDAAGFIDQLKEEGRYLKDVY
jgi:sulfite reductase (NADPH) flavoprotein alpha-component